MKTGRPPLAGASEGRWDEAYRPQSSAPSPTRQVCLRWHGRRIAKLVLTRPGGELALVMPYRHRRVVRHVSVPPAVLAYAHRAGARRWIVRLDGVGECYALPLGDVERVGWLRRHRDGWPEWFVPLSAFSSTVWLDWRFIEDEVDVDGGEQPQPVQQLPLFDAGAGGVA